MWVKERTMLDAEKRSDSQEAAASPSYRFQTISNNITDTHNSRLGSVLPTRRVHLLLSTMFSRLISRKRDHRACLLLVYPFGRAGKTGTHGDGIPRYL